MKLVAMQPYFLPNINYFNLLKSADIAVLLDDVSISNRTWINRNYFTLENSRKRVTVNLRKHSQSEQIKNVKIHNDFRHQVLLDRFGNSYGSSPIWPSIESMLQQGFAKNTSISELNHEFLKHLLELEKSETKLVTSSSILTKNNVAKTERILLLCHETGCNEFINNESGIWQYDSREFSIAGIKLTPFVQETGPRTEVSYLDILLNAHKNKK